MSIERELGQIHEAVSNLKKGQDEMQEQVKSLNRKFDIHLERFTSLKMTVAKISVTVSLITAGVLTAVRKVIAE